jgi:hypothetical protein
MDNETKKQPIILFRSTMVLPFSHYYHGKNDIYGLPETPDFEEYNLEKHRIESLSQLFSFFEKKVMLKDEFWLVIRGIGAYRGVNLNYDILKEFIENHCDIIERNQFQDAKIFLLKIDSLKDSRVPYSSKVSTSENDHNMLMCYYKNRILLTASNRRQATSSELDYQKVQD